MRMRSAGHMRTMTSEDGIFVHSPSAQALPLLAVILLAAPDQIVNERYCVCCNKYILLQTRVTCNRGKLGICRTRLPLG